MNREDRANGRSGAEAERSSGWLRLLCAAACIAAGPGVTQSTPAHAAGGDAELVATLGAIRAVIPALMSFGNPVAAGLATLHRMAPSPPGYWQADIPVSGEDQCRLLLVRNLPLETHIVVTFPADPAAPNIEAGNVGWLRSEGTVAFCRTDRGWGAPAKVRLGLRLPDRPTSWRAANKSGHQWESRKSDWYGG